MSPEDISAGVYFIAGIVATGYILFITLAIVWIVLKVGELFK